MGRLQMATPAISVPAGSWPAGVRKTFPPIPQHSNRRRITASSTEQRIKPPYKSTRLRNGRHLPGHSMDRVSCCSPGTRLRLAILISTAELDCLHGRGKLCLWDTGTLTHCATETLSGKKPWVPGNVALSLQEGHLHTSVWFRFFA